MGRIVFIGSHLGYPMDRTPLGGGAMVGLQMARSWAQMENFELEVLGSGSLPPCENAAYRQLVTTAASPSGSEDELVRLSELGYARFCREFESAATAYLETRRKQWDPKETVVVVNDISEGPDFARIAEMGYPIVSIWHVDVVDFFNKIYLHGMVKPERLTRGYAKLQAWGLKKAVPDLLKLVFDKQEQAVRYSQKLIVPSTGMAETLKSCYRHLPEPVAGRITVLPWGGWHSTSSPVDIAEDLAGLRNHYQIGPKTLSLMTLSRISPEKGISILLEALGHVENMAGFSGRDLCVFICGEPAFMKGQSYYARVRRAARRLKRARVFFPGYLSPKEKQMYFRLADVFVSPSVHESYGLSIVEALQAGLPVVASDHSGVEEILRPEFSEIVPYYGAVGSLGRLGKHGRLAARLARGLARAVADPRKLQEMGANALRASRDMSFAVAAQRLADSALELTGSR